MMYGNTDLRQELWLFFSPSLLWKQMLFEGKLPSPMDFMKYFCQISKVKWVKDAELSNMYRLGRDGPLLKQFSNNIVFYKKNPLTNRLSVYTFVFTNSKNRFVCTYLTQLEFLHHKLKNIHELWIDSILAQIGL